MPELTITSLYVLSRVDSSTLTIGQPYARVDLNPMPELTLSPPVRDFGFGLCTTFFCRSNWLHTNPRPLLATWEGRADSNDSKKYGRLYLSLFYGSTKRALKNRENKLVKKHLNYLCNTS
jgi:hypothetical protein